MTLPQQVYQSGIQESLTKQSSRNLQTNPITDRITQIRTQHHIGAICLTTLAYLPERLVRTDLPAISRPVWLVSLWGQVAVVRLGEAMHFQSSLKDARSRKPLTKPVF